jgi:threonine/homoserine efflux transporter RhtA
VPASFGAKRSAPGSEFSWRRIPISPACRHAFERTRRLLRDRNQTIGPAVAFSLMSCAFVFRDGHVEWILLRDKPPVGIAWALTGIVCWVAAHVIGRRATRASATAGDHQDDVP